MRYAPPDPDLQRIQQDIAEARLLTIQREAVTAELRAIGIEPDASRTLLRRVPARVAKSLCSGMRGPEARSVGRAFAEGEKHWIVADVAPSGLAEDGHTVAYVFDASACIRVEGKLSKTCHEMELARLKGLLSLEAQSDNQHATGQGRQSTAVRALTTLVL